MKRSLVQSIINEYSQKQKYELKKFRDKNCVNCKNNNTDICNITRNIDGNLVCVYKEKGNI